MYPATVLVCIEDQCCTVQLKLSPHLAASALQHLPATWSVPQHLQYAEISALLESCKNGLAPGLLEIKISLPTLPPL